MSETENEIYVQFPVMESTVILFNDKTWPYMLKLVAKWKIPDRKCQKSRILNPDLLKYKN